MLLITNSWRTKLQKVLIEKFLVSFGTCKHNFLSDFTDIIKLCNTLETTKGNIFQVQGMFSNPFGINSPITLPVKIILQKLF